ncbi:NADP-dependent oxidoreductase [Pleomorphomonas diazotrophica]|uniref:NADP-dependent oxidoreductase n=1 Tax=Pleomorphomonas diazotrophica TaxID=1166257 RepID=A0A2N3LTB6_9HYPH|nr:NADP-dependent oxidoreductase [Pleomorphomonas diazotrophica]PKR87764.1 NADP-dependent oxidoreductase [Pleomorphomonas diazotrophica]
MHAAVIESFGGPEVLKLAELNIPTPGEGDVLIRVEAAGIGAWDRQERAGEYDGVFGVPSTFPYVLGWDGAGTVAAVGHGVTRFRPGDPVYAASMPLPRGGFYAEYAAVEEQFVSKRPKQLSVEQAAALPWDSLTALSGLKVLELVPGDTLMIFGASGGIGHMAVQLAKHLGYRVFAVASGADGVALVRSLGADFAADGRRDDVVSVARQTVPEGFGGALVTVGGEGPSNAIKSVRAGGRIACPNGVVPLPTAAGGTELVLYDGDRTPEAMEQVNTIVERGGLIVHVAEVFPLHAVQAAHRRLQSHYVGKLVLKTGRSGNALGSIQS